MISSKDISFLVQGAISPKYTKDCLDSIARYFPAAEVVLSSWESSKVDGLNFTKCVLSKDPGGNRCGPKNKDVNNCNREIVSVKAGLKLCTRKYVIKTRSDISFKNGKILSYADINLKREPQYTFTANRIIVCSIYSRLFAINAKGKIFPLLFHPSDWIYMGLKEDISDLFDIPLTDEPDFSMWFNNNYLEPTKFEDAHPYRYWKFAPESYIWSSYLHKKIDFRCEHKLDITASLLRLSIHSILNNFYICDQEQLGINLEKYNINQVLMPKIDREGLFTNYVWQKYYKRYLDKKYRVKYTKSQVLGKIIDLLHIKRNKR